VQKNLYFGLEWQTMPGGAMVAVKGVYNGGNMVKIDAGSVSSIHEPYEVVVAFLHPVKTGQDYNDEAAKQVSDKRKAGFRTFMEYQGRLPADFDYRKELADYREKQ
jgi:hypothetical protein